MFKKSLIAGCCVLAVTLATDRAFAQRGGNSARGGSTSSGLFGSRTLGGNLQPGGNSLFGGTRGGGINGSATTQELQAGTLTGSERFLNANRDATRNFVGVDAAEVRSVGTVGASGTSQGLGNALNQFRQFGQFRQQLNNFNNFNNAFGQNARTPVRIGLTLGFEPPASVGAPVSGQVEQRLTRLPGVNLVGSPQVTLEGRTAVVRGTVATERDREMVSRLLLLEPGISAVRNELTVAGTGGPDSPRLAPPAAGQFAPPPTPPQS